MIPTAVLKFGEASQGPPPDQVAAAMEQGDPPIYLQRLGPPDRLGGDSLNPNPPMDTDGRREDSGRRVRELQAR